MMQKIRKSTHYLANMTATKEQLCVTMFLSIVLLSVAQLLYFHPEPKNTGWAGLTSLEARGKVLPCRPDIHGNVVVVVVSPSGNFRHRQLIRNSWGKRLSVYFIVGLTNSSAINEDVEIELMAYNDIVLGNFYDTDVSAKHLYALIWASKECFRDIFRWDLTSPFLVKTDDDVLINVPFLLALLQNVRDDMTIICNAPTDDELREMDFPSEFDRIDPRSMAQEFCAGWGIIYPLSAAELIYRNALSMPHHKKDNYYITGLSRPVKAPTVAIDFMNSFFPPFRFVEWLLNRNSTSFIFTQISPKRLPELWGKLTEVDIDSPFTFRMKKLKSDIDFYLKEYPETIFEWIPYPTAYS